MGRVKLSRTVSKDLLLSVRIRFTLFWCVHKPKTANRLMKLYFPHIYVISVNMSDKTNSS